MFLIRKTFRFEASHQLPNHDGKCRRLHGHSWVMRVEIRGAHLIQQGSKAGMMMDYGDISAIVKPFIDDVLDHRHLNDTTKLLNPTSEALAEWIYWQMHDLIVPKLDTGHRYNAIEIEETCTSWARYEVPS